MGKRKERRLAAKTNAGRRVKLDVFAEPSGDLGDSAENDEHGGDIYSKGRAGLPNSPSSSGQQPQNPLLLLGQYSDDELDDDSNKILSDASVENSSPENNDEVKSSLGESCQNLDTNVSEDLASQMVKQQGMDTNSVPHECDQNLEDSDKRENDDVASSDLHAELDLTEQISVPETSNAQVVGDVSSGWKIVMHEESNSYYYWNTETGETSWEVPDVLAQATKLTCDEKTPSVAGKTENIFGTQESNFASGVKLDGFSNVDTVEGSANIGHGSQVGEWNLGGNDGAMHDMMANEDHELGIDLPSRLVKHSEALLERLKSLQGSKDQLQGPNWISKYFLEVEIRIFDFKSLLSYGSSLLPFWMHSERQLKQLESAIDDEMSKIAKSVLDEVEATHASFTQGENNFQESMECKTEADRVGNELLISTLDDCRVTPGVDASTIVSKDLDIKGCGLNAEHVSASAFPTGFMESGASEQANGVVVPDESTTKNEFCAGEDDDMDVDMEVEDSNSAGNTAVAYALNVKEFTPLEQPIQPGPPSEYASLVSENAFTVPPPPDEEWIPPPPPDNEQVPPPPPDDPPPEPPHPPLPSYPEIGQPSYAEQYNFSYPGSSFEYYGHTVTEVPSSTFYGHAEGGQVAIPHAPVYYGAVPGTYTESAQVAANPVESVIYYGIQDSTGPAAPIVSSIESTQFHSESAPLSYNNLASDHTGSINTFSAAGSSGSLPNVNVDGSAVDSEIDGASVEVPSTTATIQAPATVSVRNTVSLPSTNSVSTATSILPPVVTKAQSKVPRTKKRTVAVGSSMRSNKKVSSLVDKWKAAKEELLEDEEEPENAYELLERKRKREIEEWYAQQITSGEAKDNANFQPLGGNWREKVRRRKAQLAREAAKTASEAPTDGNKQPDLTELSRDLPSGWQAYWDESSKQVYFGNTVTSETRWTKPTK